MSLVNQGLGGVGWWRGETKDNALLESFTDIIQCASDFSAHFKNINIFLKI